MDKTDWPRYESVRELHDGDCMAAYYTDGRCPLVNGNPCWHLEVLKEAYELGYEAGRKGTK